MAANIGPRAARSKRPCPDPFGCRNCGGMNDVRGLCIGGEALRAILQERPEAAMAMLATLAERISYQ